MTETIPSSELAPVSIVGAGPGAPELLTVRAWQVLQQADWVLYDDLAGEEIIKLLPIDTETIYAGKRNKDGLGHRQRMQNIYQHYQTGYEQQLKVVRLKGGDPLLFSRAYEELEFLQAHKIPFEIVPGISSGFAGASMLGIPLTRRIHSRSLVLVTGTTIKGEHTFHDVVSYIESEANVLLYMAGEKLYVLVDFLNKHKIHPKLRIIAMSKISTPQQVNKHFTLEELSQNRNVQIETPVIFLIGKHLEVFG